MTGWKPFNVKRYGPEYDYSQKHQHIDEQRGCESAQAHIILAQANLLWYAQIKGLSETSTDSNSVVWLKA